MRISDWSSDVCSSDLIRLAMRVPEVIHAPYLRAERPPVATNPADGGAAEVGAVIAALTPDESCSASLPTCPLIGECHLECGIGRLRATVCKEHVVESRRHDTGEPLGSLERLGMAKLDRKSTRLNSSH